MGVLTIFGKQLNVRKEPVALFPRVEHARGEDLEAGLATLRNATSAPCFGNAGTALGLNTSVCAVQQLGTRARDGARVCPRRMLHAQRVFEAAKPFLLATQPRQVTDERT